MQKFRQTIGGLIIQLGVWIAVGRADRCSVTIGHDPKFSNYQTDGGK